MAYAMTLEAGAVSGGVAIREEIEAEAAARMSIDEDIADSEVDLQIAFDLDISEIAAIVIVSDQDVTVETNDGDVPVDTLNLVADTPVMFCADPVFGSNPFTVDTTDLYVTNSSGSSARLQIIAIYDPTP